MELQEILDGRVTITSIDSLDRQTRLQLLQTTTLLAVVVAQTLMEEEVSGKAGERYGRKDREGREYYRHSSNPGSVRINHEKVPVRVPRIRDRESGRVSSPDVYQEMHAAELNEETARKIIKGISTRDFDQAARTITESFGMSRDAVSRDMIQASTEALRRFENRDLSAEPYVALFIDGKHYDEEQIILAMAVTKSGEKQMVGMTQAPGENSMVVVQMLQSMIDRGFSYDEGLLCISDGSKGIAAAIQSVFGSNAAHQRCRLHKVRNVMAHLSEEHRKSYTKKLWNAYNTDDYSEAKTALIRCVQDLRRINPSAAASLEEGLEETLTLQKLKLNDLFSKGFGTTNCIESANSQFEARTGKVTYWKAGNMRQRWVALVIDEIEAKFNRVSHYKRLDMITKAFLDRNTNN
jgi:transposase-like protein